MRKAASRATVVVLIGAMSIVGLVSVKTVDAVPATSIVYKGAQQFVVQPGEGWLVHTQYTPQKNNSDSPITVGSFHQDAFHCVGGECPQFLQYHFGDTVDLGVLEDGVQIRLRNYLHDNPEDGRRTRIMKDGSEVHVCAEGWVAPDCVYAVNQRGQYTIRFEDSVAVEIVKIEPQPTVSPTAAPTVAPTATPVATVTPTAAPTQMPQTTLAPATGGDGRSDGRTDSLACLRPEDNCNPQPAGQVLGAQTLPVTGGGGSNVVVMVVTALIGLMGLSFYRLSRMVEEEVWGRVK